MLRQKIKDDLKSALKARRKDDAQTLRLVTAEIINQEKEKRYQLGKKEAGLRGEGSACQQAGTREQGTKVPCIKNNATSAARYQNILDDRSQLSEEEITKLLFSQVKQRKDAIQDFKRGERQDLVEKEMAEIQILNKYLPEQLSSTEIENQAKQIIADLGAKDIKDMGRVMPALMAKLGARAGGGEAGQIVKRLLVRV